MLNLLVDVIRHHLITDFLYQLNAADSRYLLVKVFIDFRIFEVLNFISQPLIEC